MILFVISIILNFQRNEIGPENAKYAFPELVLNFIGHLVPGNIKGEIREVSQLFGAFVLLLFVN